MKLSITERGQERSFEVAEATLRIRTLFAREVQLAPEGAVAISVELDGKDRSGAFDDRAPRIAIRPIFRKLTSLAALSGVTVEMANGYDKQLEEHVATIYVWDHQTLGRTSLRFGPLDGDQLAVELDAACPDTEYYDARAKPGVVQFRGTVRVEPSLYVVREFRTIRAKR